MKQFLKVFKFEYGNYAKNKVFIGLTCILLIGVTLVLFFPRFKGDKSKPLFPTGDKKQVIAVIDNSQNGDIADYLTAMLTDCEIKPAVGDTDIARQMVESSDFSAVLVIESPLKYTYVVNNMGIYDSLPAVIDELLLSKYRAEYMSELGLNGEQISQLTLSSVESQSVIVGNDQTQSFFYTYILMFLLYMAVLMYGQFVAQSVATEKSSRAMELLITSAEPKSLIFGKILGAGTAGLTQILLLLIWSFVCYKINRSYWNGNFIIDAIFGMTSNLIIYTAVFFISGFLIYAFLYGALGSLASKMEDISTLTTPVTFIMIISFIVTVFSISSGKMDSVLIKVLSFIPFSSPLAMFSRIAMNTVSSVEIAVSIAILIVSNIIIGYLAVAIYRIGILMYGKPPKLNEIIRAIKSK